MARYSNLYHIYSARYLAIFYYQDQVLNIQNIYKYVQYISSRQGIRHGPNKVNNRVCDKKAISDATDEKLLNKNKTPVF